MSTLMNLFRPLALCSLVVLPLLSACPDDPPTPEEKCGRLAAVHCGKRARCGSSQNLFRSKSEEQTFFDKCESGFLIDCREVTSISTGFDTCLADIERATCEIKITSGGSFTPVFPIPTSCDHVLDD